MQFSGKETFDNFMLKEIYPHLSARSQFEPLDEVRQDNKSQWKKRLFYGTCFLGVIGTGAAAYAWYYHPEKVLEFKNSYIMPTVHAPSSFAQTLYKRLFKIA